MKEFDAAGIMLQFGRTLGAIAWTCNVAVEELPPEHRIIFFNRIMAGYCKHCGDRTQETCHCTNDE